MTAGEHRPLGVAFGGFIALAAAMGIGRFVYTPILPFMADGLGLSKSEAGLIASANFLGYMLGALAAASPALRASKRNMATGALVVSALSTGAVGLFSSLAGFLVLRFIGGVASAFALVFSSTLVMDRLAAAKRPALIALYFAGVGTGIVTSALLVAGLAAAGYDWREFWFASGALSLAAVALFIAFVPQAGDVPAQAQAASGNGPDRRLVALIVSYGLFGFGYVITATFISAIVRAEPPLKVLEPAIWLIVGVGAIPSVAVWAWVGRRIGNGRAYALACLVEAVAVTFGVISLAPVVVALSALLLGGTFVGITATGLVDARELSRGDPRRNIALMTAIFGIGQMIGPTFGGVLHDLSGSFRLPTMAAATVLLAASLLVFATASAGPHKR